jgi:hypothetical protein
MTQKPCILIVGRSNYLGIARLPHALRIAGAEVGGLCFRNDFLAHTDFLDWRSYWGERKKYGICVEKILALPIFLSVIWRKTPDLIIPGDESAVKLIRAAQKFFLPLLNIVAPRAAAGLRRSLPDTEKAYRAITRRWPNHELAMSLGIACPEGEGIQSQAQLEAFAVKHGLPVVVKFDDTNAGSGVHICSKMEQIAQVWAKAARHDASPSGIVQSHKPGKPGLCALVAFEGRLLAQFCIEKTESYPRDTSPSSQVTLIAPPTMPDTAEKLVAAMNYTGFMGVDFMVDPVTGHCWLIECNPRPVPVSNWGALSLMLVQALGGGQEGRVAHHVPELGTVLALFPQEWLRCKGAAPDPALRHDIPLHDPGLVKAYTAVIEAAQAAGE